MPRQITVVTPENVSIEYELAGVGSRGLAAVVDMLLQGGCIALVVIARELLEVHIAWLAHGWVNAALGVVTFVVFWGYYVFFETVWNGQTLGKRWLRLRTVREGGLPVDLPCAAIRNLVRIIDFLPVFYLVGAVSMVATSRSKRLGDLAAGTLVVKERSEWMGKVVSDKPVVDQHSPVAAYVKNIELVTPDEFEAVKRFVERKAELQETVREGVAVKIARPLMVRLGIEDQSGIVYSNLLGEIYNRCVEHRGMR